MSSTLADLIVAAFIVAGMGAILVYVLVAEWRSRNDPNESFDDEAPRRTAERRPTEPRQPGPGQQPPVLPIGRDAPTRAPARTGSRQLLP